MSDTTTKYSSSREDSSRISRTKLTYLLSSPRISLRKPWTSARQMPELQVWSTLSNLRFVILQKRQFHRTQASLCSTPNMAKDWDNIVDWKRHIAGSETS